MNMNPEPCSPPSIGWTASGVTVEWSHNSKTISGEPALFVFTELATGNQTQYQIAPNFHTCLPLTAGIYSVAIFAKDLERYRGTLDLRPGATTLFKPVLNPSTLAPKTLKQVISRFDVDHAFGARDLDVPRNTTVVLDQNDTKFSSDWKQVEIKDVATAKRIVGYPNEIWSANYPRFKALSVSLNDNPDALARQASREYVYGNSATVKQWEDQINQSVFDETWRFPLFILGTVTINAGGVLVIGDRANFFVCERLRMHVTATLLIRGAGPIHVEPVSLETFC
jgi:hypothetical protein